MAILNDDMMIARHKILIDYQKQIAPFVPTICDIADVWGVKSTAAFHTLQRLLAMGLVVSRQGTYRGSCYPSKSGYYAIRRITGKNMKTFKEELSESNDPINLWFELSYARYLTVPRLVMQSMPVEWQRKMAVLLEEMDETFDWRPKEGRYWVQLRDDQGRYVEPPLEDYRRGSCKHLRRTQKD